MSTRHSNNRVDLCDHYSRLEAMQRARFHKKDSHLSRQRWQGPHTRVCSGSSSRIVHSSGDLLGAYAAAISHLLFLGSYRKGMRLDVLCSFFGVVVKRLIWSSTRPVKIKANNYYQLFITWTSQKLKKTFVERNMFDFKHIKPFDRSYIDKPGPMVVFATPGMLHAGLSLQIFKKWAPFEQNMIIIPGYCVAGTVGHKILNGQKKIEFENKQIVS
jgi:hypothetical protein